MKKFLKKFSVIAIIFCLFVSYIPKTQAYTIDPIDEKIECAATVDDEFADDRVLIVLNEESSYSLKDYTAADFSELGCTKVEDLTYNATKAVRDELAAKANGNILKPEDENPLVDTENYKRVLSLDLNKKSKENVLQTANRLLARNDVYYAGPDYVLTAQSTEPNDPINLIQWTIPDIGLPQCWDFTIGSPEVIVGVLDTGIDASHEDLSGAIAYNLCRDFTTGSEVVVSSPVDPDGHGTNVAGIIGAVGNNNKGISGVCWSVKLASLRILNSDGEGLSSYVVKAISFAQENGIKVLNLSARWLATIHQGFYDVALDTAISNYAGTFVCASGNEAYDIDENIAYPASYKLDKLITVGAINRSNERANFSNYGANSVDIYACGTEIYTTDLSNVYVKTQGTSMAAPFVTGVAALLLSIKPELSVYQIKRAILNESDLISITLPNGTHQTVKKLNAFGAVKYVLSGYAGPHDLSYGNVSFDRNINSDKTLFFEKNALERLIVKSQFNYGFSVSANDKISVDLYDENFNAITLSKSMHESGRRWSFNVDLSAGTYYLRVKQTETALSGNVSVAITCPPHTHDFSNWVYKDRTSHVQACECGANNGVTGAHQIDPEFAGAKKAPCIFCHHIISTSDIIIIPGINNQLSEQ